MTKEYLKYTCFKIRQILSTATIKSLHDVVEEPASVGSLVTCFVFEALNSVTLCYYSGPNKDQYLNLLFYIITQSNPLPNPPQCNILDGRIKFVWQAMSQIKNPPL